jgi:predicted enzyme involved in methoxymalonyl-ACP biosynthesis
MNIGLDSMVFVDDNPVERNLVRKFLPEVLFLRFLMMFLVFQKLFHLQVILRALDFLGMIFQGQKITN